MEQVEQLSQRAGWEAPPVIVLLDAEFEVLHMHVLEGYVGLPTSWIQRYKAQYGPLVELCANLIFVSEQQETVYHPEFQDFPPFEEIVRVISLFSKETVTHSLVVTQSTGAQRWAQPEEELMSDSIEAFERLMVNAL